ncbi:UNVERIFIED_CONTAM: hypothetical protein Slati_3461200 [Sesamum latifolium]|uniref:Reverse transcriptase Ty1/copia-type domain-containing protein n=1 Tax=Sesamum latifolium TaxID=2727402 RepID=A0AAW2UGK1_9LAMI
MKEVYAVPGRHIRYAATKAFLGTKMTKGSSVQSHGVKMLSLVGKAVVAEAEGSLSLVISDHIRIDLKDCYYVPNVCGPLNTPARGGHSYFITFTDDHSHYGYVYLISRRDEVLLEESSEAPQQNDATSFEPSVPTDGVPVFRRSIRESRPPERYGFIGLTSQLDNDPRTYREAMSDIDSDKWLEAMKSEMNSMGSNQVWTLVDPPKGVKPVGCKWVYKHKLGADGEVIAFKAKLMTKGYTLNDLGSILRKPTRQ